MRRRLEQRRQQVEFGAPFERQLLDLGRVVDEVRFVASLEVERRRLGRMRLRRGSFSPGTFDCGAGRISIGQIGSPVWRLKE